MAMDKSAADAFVYAKASGMLARSFTGERAVKLFNVHSLKELWTLLFNKEVPVIPEKLLAKALESEAQKDFISQYYKLLNKAGGAARMQLKTTGTTYVAGEGKPTITVASVVSKALTINWTENKEADRYVVRVADTLHYMNGDSIGYNHIDSVIIYEQIPYMVDSVCLAIDTVTATTYRASNLETGVAYHFMVQAMDVKGNLGIMSDMVSETTVSLS